MQPRVKAFVARLDDLIQRLEQHMRLRLAQAVDLSDTGAVVRAVDAAAPHDLTLSSLAATLSDGKPSQPLDPAWVKRAAQLLESLKDLRWRYVEGPTQRGRATMGMVNSTGCTSVWGSTFPYHPYPFPWTSHLFQDSPSVAMGLFEGHMAKMAEGFKAVRMAEMELKGAYRRGARPRLLQPLQLGAVQRRGMGACARRWSASAATERCMTSASRTCRA